MVNRIKSMFKQRNYSDAKPKEYRTLQDEKGADLEPQRQTQEVCHPAKGKRVQAIRGQ